MSRWERGEMETFSERLIVAASTIDELMSENIEPLPGQKTDTDRAALRLAAWCRSSASGNWRQFTRRLHRDGWDFPMVLERFASVRRTSSAPAPPWVGDAFWIDAALRSSGGHAAESAPESRKPVAFEQLLLPVVHQADARMWAGVAERAAGMLADTARASLRQALLQQLSELCAPALYTEFDNARASRAASSYQHFVTEMGAAGFRRLFEAKPVLLRLIAVMTRQWIDTTTELVTRLDTDLLAIRTELLGGADPGHVTGIHGDLGDPHRGGRSVHIVMFADGARIVYKPKDLRIDVALCDLVDRINRAAPPLELRAVRALACAGYGWTEFIEHAPCADQQGFERYFARAGAWLALFHCLAASDIHQENIIAAGEHPVPIDVETLLQPAMEEPADQAPESQGFHDALEIVANSVMSVGLLPSYERSPDNKVFASGGLVSDWNVKTPIRWTDINTDAMRPIRSREPGKTTPNLPRVGSCHARFIDHVDALLTGFEDYAGFLAASPVDAALDGFAGLPVRIVPRPTKFYAMMLSRLRDHRTMNDGVLWSAQADFVARLADWDTDNDPRWPLLEAERSALLTLNVPFFTSPSDGTDLRDDTGISISSPGVSGVDRARARIRGFDPREIAWQLTVIRQNMESFRGSAGISAGNVEPSPGSGDVNEPTREMFIAEADRVATELTRYAIRRGTAAAWIALDWSSDSDTFELICLGHDLYNGVSGIALFFAAHAAVTGCTPSHELALAAVAHLRKELRGHNAAPAARALGLGGGSGLASIVYALAVMSKCLHDDALLADAQAVAALITDDLIAADKQLDVMGGSAGAILGLLRLYRDTRSGDVLDCATRCGEHLLAEPRVGPEGRRTWRRPNSGKALNGMSHGAAGFAYALSSLAAATGRPDFAVAASECIAFENSSYSREHHNWPDLRGDGGMHWPSQWCHGAPGIGLARIAISKLPQADTATLTADVRNALQAVESGWSSHLRDTLCCGSLGSVEFLSEAGTALGRPDLRELATRQLAGIIYAAAARGDYRWSASSGRFNPGLFRGLAGVGYTALRRVEDSLPDVLIWE